MQFQPINLREKYDQARLRFDHQLAAMLIARTDLSHAQTGRKLGISQKMVRRVVKQFNIGPRRRGPKPMQDSIASGSIANRKIANGSIANTKIAQSSKITSSVG
jgi:hypothetical protein